MKILLATGIYPPDVGGPATYTHALAHEFIARKHEVRVVAYGKKDERITEKNNLTVTRVDRFRTAPFRYLAYFRSVFRDAKWCDAIYLQGPVSEGFPATLVSLLLGKPTLMKIVGDYAWESYMLSSDKEAGSLHAYSKKELLDEFLTHRHRGKIGWIEKIERWTARCADHIIVPSNYLKRVVRQWGVPSSKITLLYNFVEPFQLIRYTDFVRQKVGILPKHRVILTAVRAVPWKNIDFIIRLLPDLSEDIVLAVAGDGPSLNVWRQEAERCNVSHRVYFLGRLSRSELGEWYQAADCFVLPSSYEGYPHVIAEAVSLRLPCFVSDKGGNPETEKMEGTLVTVLPHLSVDDWKRALSGQWKLRYVTGGLLNSGSTEPNIPKHLRLKIIVDMTLRKIESVL
jgi:glycosyltransferase involved in cell wall biosynthesis